MSSLYQIAFHVEIEKTIRFQYEHLFPQRQTVTQKPIRYVTIHFQHRRSTVSPRYVRCVFRAGVRAIRHTSWLGFDDLLLIRNCYRGNTLTLDNRKKSSLYVEANPNFRSYVSLKLGNVNFNKYIFEFIVKLTSVIDFLVPIKDPTLITGA